MNHPLSSCDVAIANAIIEPLTKAGYAVTLFTPEECAGLAPEDVVDAMIRAGNDFITNNKPAPRKAWSSGWNIPGYLPDDEPMNFDTWAQSRDALVEALHQAGDDESIRDEEHQLYLNAIDQLGRADPEFDWSTRIGNYVWWLQHIELPAGRD